jgi:DtxR family Mn-dependent transcriptional regulator
MTTRKDLSAAMEDYLKVAYLLREDGQTITVQALAQALGISPPSVTGMVKRLTSMGLLQHTAYQHIQFTPAGEAIALEMIRHHRLLELYLAEFLGMPWEDVHAEADRLEHHISEDLEERISQRLGDPLYDPHGDPIPTRDLVLPYREVQRLVDLPEGQGGIVARIGRQDRGLLQYLGTLGLVPGSHVTLVSCAPYVETVTVRVGGTGKDDGVLHVIGMSLAAHLMIATHIPIREDTIQ